MIEPIVLRFATAGIGEVGSAFARVSTQIRKFEENATRERERGVRARGEATRRGLTAEERAAQKLARDNERIEREKTRGAEKEQRRREALQRRSSEAAGRFAAEQARQEMRDQQKVTRELEREEERRMRIRIRSSEMAGRVAAREAAAEVRATERAARTRGATGRSIGGVVTGSVGGLARGAMTLAGATLGLGGGLAIASAAHAQLSDERAAALLVNSATAGGVKQQGASVANILGQAGQVAKETGTNRGELIGAVNNYVRLAGADQFGSAMANMGFFAKMAKASGSSLEDITGAAGILQAQNKSLDPKGMQQMLLDMMEQGKAGAVEIKDMASLAGALGSTRGLYQGSATENQRKLLGLAQISRTEKMTAEDAATSISRMGQEATEKAAKKEAPAWLKAAVDAKTGQIKGGPEQLIEAALLGTKGNLGQLTAVFGAHGVAPYDRLAPIFNAAGGGAAGIEAIRKEMAPIMGAKGSAGGLEQQYQEVMSTPAEKTAVAFEKIRTIIEEKLEPRLEQFANKLEKSGPQIEKLIDAVDKVATFFIENPFTGIGAIVLAKISADLLQAGIGPGVKAVLESVAGGGTPVPGAAGGAGGLLPKVAGAGAVATLGIASVVGQSNIMSGLGAGKAQGKADVAQTLAGVRSGTVTAADVAKLQQQASLTVQATSGAGAVVKGVLGSTGIDPLAQMLGLVGKGKSIAGGEDAATIAKQQAAALEMQKAAKALTDAANKIGPAVANLQPVRSNAPTQPIANRPVQ